jgi:hypothetical protein
MPVLRVAIHPFFNNQYRASQESNVFWEGTKIQYILKKDGKTFALSSDGSRWFTKNEEHNLETWKDVSILGAPMPSSDWPGLFEINVFNRFTGNTIPLVGEGDNWWENL